MFIDEAIISVRSGKGGDGAISFRREKFLPQGGPDGGDGGKGGDVYFVTDSNLNTLLDFNNKKEYAAGDAEKGKKKKMYGLNGKDIEIKVPLGTLIKDVESGKVLVDFIENTRLLFLKGGKGGKGNFHFKSSIRQAPYIALKGKKGIEVKVKLELKLLADVALIGLPNAGKSTLINTISAAKSKVGSYPFTTLEPKLGVVKVFDRTYVVSDIPGLIEGASQGKGLGIKFLKHIERSKIIFHLIESCSIDDYLKIRKEIEAYSPILAKKKECVLITKSEQIGKSKEFEDFLKKNKIDFIYISSFTREGIEEAKKYAFTELQKYKQEDNIVPVTSIYDLFKSKEEKDILVTKLDDNLYQISGRILTSVLDKYVLSVDTFDMLLDILRKEKLDKYLVEAGVKANDTIRILSQEFRYVE